MKLPVKSDRSKMEGYRELLPYERVQEYAPEEEYQQADPPDLPGWMVNWWLTLTVAAALAVIGLTSPKLALFLGMIGLIYCINILTLVTLFGAFKVSFNVVQFNVGPRLFQFTGKKIRYSVHLFPLGTTVNSDVRNSETGNPLPVVTAVTFICAPIIVLFLLSCLYLGPAATLHEVQTGWFQAANGGLHPLSTGASHVAAAVQYAQSSSSIILLATTIAKYISVQLLPICVPAVIILHFSRLLKRPEAIVTIIGLLAFLAGMLLLGSWLIAVIVYTMN